MELALTEEQELITGMVRRFVREEIVPLEMNLDPDADALDPEDAQRLKRIVQEMGLYGLGIPKEYGGPDLDMVTSTLIAIEMSQHRAGLYVPCYGVFGGAGLAQLFEANDDQKERYLYPTLRGEKSGFFGLTEPSGGSDPARAIQTKAVRDGDDWIINGSKIFISGADKADYGLVFARTRSRERAGRGDLFHRRYRYRGLSRSAASCTRYARRVMRPSCSSKICACPAPMCVGDSRQGICHRQ
ncbi:MAG: acyl-CoA dehydrogenase family protein [Gammaproteobacteria bacterium]|nr:acyl-CoA dehydrogenase family protein [Gammaproteobacteria bacterium]